MEIYYPILIPLFLSLISFITKKEKKKISEIDDIIKIFNKMTKNPNINSFLGIILNELTSLFLITDDFNSTLLNFFIRVVSLHNTYYFYPLVLVFEQSVVSCDEIIAFTVNGTGDVADPKDRRCRSIGLTDKGRMVAGWV